MSSSASLSLDPGKSLGPFRLGVPLGQVVAYVRDSKNMFRCVELKYADQDMINQDIVLNFPEHGIHLRFEPKSQRLRLIEAYDLTRAQVYYHGKPVGGAQHPATFVRVYEICGRTYPGEYDPQSKMYFLHYPGLLFMFPIPSQHAHLAAMEELPIEFPDGTTPVASRLVISSGSYVTPRAIIAAQPPPMLAGDPYYEVVEARLGVGLRFCSGGQTVCFGDTPQDVWSELGCPSQTLSKGVETMAINAGASEARGVQPLADYFYNYANRGLDILFCGRMNVVKKFVLRTNAPGHPEFSAYQKCNFRLLVPGSDTSADLPTSASDSGAVQDANSRVSDRGSSPRVPASAPHSERESAPSRAGTADAELDCSHVEEEQGWERPPIPFLEAFGEWQFQPAFPLQGSEGWGQSPSQAAPEALQPPEPAPSSVAYRDDPLATGASSEVAPVQDERDGWEDWDANLLVHAPDSSSEASVRPPSFSVSNQRSMEFRGPPPPSTLMPQEDTSGMPFITADSTWRAVKDVMGDAGRATIHSRQRMQTYIYGFKGVAFEVMRNGHLASMTLFRP